MYLFQNIVYFDTQIVENLHATMENIVKKILNVIIHGIGWGTSFFTLGQDKSSYLMFYAGCRCHKGCVCMSVGFSSGFCLRPTAKLSAEGLESTF
jgi:hypothetical protein